MHKYDETETLYYEECKCEKNTNYYTLSLLIDNRSTFF